MVLSIIFIGSLGLSRLIKSYATSQEAPTEEENDDMLLELLNESHQPLPSAQDPDEDIGLSDDIDSFEEQDTEMLTDQPVRLADIYSENGSTVTFKCFDTDAASYEWEYYSLEAKAWTAAEEQDIQSCKDELNRMVSCFKVNAGKDAHGSMVRCTIHYSGKEDEIQMASLFILKDGIKDIQVDDFTANADAYISTRELPAKIIYQDGSTEDVVGLNDFYFLKSEEEKDYSTSISGNRIETTTLITTECNYFYTGENEEQTALMRYRTEKGNNPLETTCKITGQDLLPPVISDVTISPYEVSSIDQPVNLTVTILAEDEITPYPELEYAFIFSEEEPEEADWNKKPTFDVCIDRNGSYTAYSRDQAGNIGQMEKEIITVDTKAPIIDSVSLSNASGWCQSNTIIVEAQDAGAISYCYMNMSSGEASDWITFSEYSVDTNGSWIIQVKDDAGNITETEIEVSNIDREAPVIHRISVK